MGCKVCGSAVAPDDVKMYGQAAISLQLEATTWSRVGGDGYAYELARPEDAGTFCSWGCLAHYAAARAPKPKERPTSVVLVAAFDEEGKLTHEERVVRPLGHPLDYDIKPLPDGIQVTVKFGTSPG